MRWRWHNLGLKVAEKLKIKNINIYKNFGTAAISFKDIKLEFNGARKRILSNIK